MTYVFYEELFVHSERKNKMLFIFTIYNNYQLIFFKFIN